MKLSPARLSGSIGDAMARFGVPGMSAALIEEGRVAWSEGFGSRVDAATVFAVASLSKPPFAYAVVRLSERGVLDLDTPLADLDPERYDAYGLDPEAPELRLITARHVLSHASGMGNWAPEDVGRIAFPPGSRWHYSGEGYVYLQAVVERATRSTLDDLAEVEVFRPLGMQSSSYLPGAGASEGRHFTRAYASHSLHTTAPDYARFVADVLQSDIGRIMLAPQITIDDSLAWGLGWGLAGHVFWHWGEMQHFSCAAVASTRDGRGLVCLTNGDEGLAACVAVVEDTLADEYAVPLRAVVERGW